MFITIAAPVIALFFGAMLNHVLIGVHVLVGSVLVLGSLLLYQFEGVIRRVLFGEVEIRQV